MKKWMISLIVTLLISGVQAQIKVTGSVKDQKGRILAGANIVVKGSYDGTVSDSTGSFSFKTYEKGKQFIVASSIGNKTVEQEVNIDSLPIHIDFILKEEISELKAVTVTAGSFEAGDKKRAATVLSSLDVYTTGGANADISAVVKTLPGAQQVGEQEGLFVRGGAGYEAKQFIDGTLVNNPFFASVPDIASRGRFAPALFKGTVFSTGGYSALYGQALSSALIMESIDIPDRSEVSASISSVFLGAGLQKVAKNKKSSWGGNYGYTNLLPYFSIVKQKPDYFRMPEFHTADLNFRMKTKNGGMLKYYGTFGASDLGLRRANIDDPNLKNAFGLNNINVYNNLSWRENLGNGWKMNLGLGYSTDYNDIDQQIQNQQNQKITTGQPWIDNNNFTIKTRSDLSQIKAVFDKRLSGISVLRTGGEYMYFYNSSTFNNQKATLPDHFKALFTEADLYITNDLAAKVGVRFEHSSLINKANIAPRLSLAYKTGKGAQMSIAYGEFYQKPENNYLYTTTNFGYSKATHFIANYIKNTALQTFRVEAFYKKYDGLVKTHPVLNNAGAGDAKGVELFWRDKKTIKGLDYWISYSYLDTKRDFLNYSKQLQPTFAANHTASFVMKRFISKINTGFNFTYSYATGRPYYNLVQNGSQFTIADQGKTIDYHNLGFSFNYLTSMGKAYAVFVGSVTNVLNSKQIFGYNYSNNGQRKEAITPPAPQFFFLGVFLSWGVDRRQDAINNNL
ncbi:MAG: TonB-dependent receptor [Sediminibacterium sp. Gen4]|jgi:vitamin B12 transporter|uniref:TonB-dependent receptor n=1 Tax=unclassified Sediminibacterium TaxID=2635961 RepID=UPI0015BD3ED7|nr:MULTISPECIES: TonB-dependent receptor [unclassified Sediminibacterium]MBW0165595.1 TonB-dependent receptor [Sediminibacterium sp.]NWK64926.1 TonB-dependent receptor [Sediminibacterium sp. Gen4]